MKWESIEQFSSLFQDNQTCSKHTFEICSLYRTSPTKNTPQIAAEGNVATLKAEGRSPTNLTKRQHIALPMVTG